MFPIYHSPISSYSWGCKIVTLDLFKKPISYSKRRGSLYITVKLLNTTLLASNLVLHTTSYYTLETEHYF